MHVFKLGLKLLPAVILMVLTGCGNKPNFMKYDVVFYAPLGTNYAEIGSNLPILQALYSNEDVISGDFMDVPTSLYLFKNKLYVADKYNNRISIFQIGGSEATNTFIPPVGDGYSYGTPFQVILNKYGEIYALVSDSNRNNKVELSTNEDETITVKKGDTNVSRYYIYKFSNDGKFIYAIGDDGIHSSPMNYPDRIDVDLFDNVYAYFKSYNNDREEWVVKRFSPSGELTFEFNTKYVATTNTVSDKVYIGRISDIYNLKNDERLMIYSENHIIKRKDKPIETPDEFYISLDVYSVLQNAITKNIMQSKKNMDDFISITKDDIVVLFSYDDKYNGIRFRFIDIGSPNLNEEVYYAPVLSEHYVHVGYFLDDHGEIYSIVVKDDGYFVLLRWRKVKSKVLS